jgi:hypothetical protein
MIFSSARFLPLSIFQDSPSADNLDAESGKHLATAKTGHAYGSAIKILTYPSSFGHNLQKSGPEAAANMRAPLTPVQARIRESPPQLSRLFNIDVKRGQSLSAAFGKIIRVSPAI